MSQEAILKFCGAQRELQNIREVNHVEKTRSNKSINMCRSMISKQMKTDSLDIVPIVCDGQTMFACMVEKKSAPMITSSMIMDAISNLHFDPSEPIPKTIEDWIEKIISTQIAKASTESSVPPKKYLKILKKCPEESVNSVSRAHPSTLSKVQDIVDTMTTAKNNIKEMNKTHDDKKKNLEKKVKESEREVADHLEKFDPTHGTRKIKIVVGGEEATYFLQRKTHCRKFRPTPRTVIPAIKGIVKKLAHNSGQSGTPGWETYRWLTSAETLKILDRDISLYLDQMCGSKESTKVTFTQT